MLQKVAQGLGPPAARRDLKGFGSDSERKLTLNDHTRTAASLGCEARPDSDARRRVTQMQGARPDSDAGRRVTRMRCAAGLTRTRGADISCSCRKCRPLTSPGGHPAAVPGRAPLPPPFTPNRNWWAPRLSKPWRLPACEATDSGP